MFGRRLARVAVALGGLVILAGIVMIGIFVLAKIGMANLDPILNGKGGLILLWMLLVVGLLDLACGILLAYSKR